MRLSEKQARVGELTVELDSLSDKEAYKDFEAKLNEARIEAKVLANKIKEKETEFQEGHREWATNFIPEARRSIPKMRKKFLEKLTSFRDAVFSENGYKGPSLFSAYSEIEDLCRDCTSSVKCYEQAFKILDEIYTCDLIPTPNPMDLQNFDYFLRQVTDHPAPSLVKVKGKVEIVRWIGMFNVDQTEFTEEELEEIWERDEYNKNQRRLKGISEEQHAETQKHFEQLAERVKKERPEQQAAKDMLIQEFKPIKIN